ncbi:hypothetical protein JTB14_029785 [Gonioctena quinquepunctata]|nr:hypothetical protein JTB14_029785 [Gonioctena quinquepunctata]
MHYLNFLQLSFGEGAMIKQNKLLGKNPDPFPNCWQNCKMTRMLCLKKRVFPPENANKGKKIRDDKSLTKIYLEQKPEKLKLKNATELEEEFGEDG